MRKDVAMEWMAKIDQMDGELDPVEGGDLYVGGTHRSPLGWLCQLSLLGDWVKRPGGHWEYVIVHKRAPNESPRYELPPSVAEWAGLSSVDPRVPGARRSFLELQKLGCSYALIRWLIQEHWRDL